MCFSRIDLTMFPEETKDVLLGIQIQPIVMNIKWVVNRAGGTLSCIVQVPLPLPALQPSPTSQQ